jgi:hypothetical protein
VARRQVSDFLGLKYETVGNVMARLREEGRIYCEGVANNARWHIQTRETTHQGKKGKMSNKRRVGDKEMVVYEWRWRACEQCDLPATHQLTFLLKGTRSNPASSAYRKNDCTYCSDMERYACRKCYRRMMNQPPPGHVFCAAFPLKQNQHLGFHREKIEVLDYDVLERYRVALEVLARNPPLSQAAVSALAAEALAG